MHASFKQGISNNKLVFKDEFQNEAEMLNMVQNFR